MTAAAFEVLHIISARMSQNRGNAMNYVNETFVPGTDLTPPSPTESALLRLSGQIENVETMVGRLEQRLGPILSSGQKGETSSKPQAVGASPVVDNILRAGDRVANIDERIGQLIDRLTV